VVGAMPEEMVLGLHVQKRARSSLGNCLLLLLQAAPTPSLLEIWISGSSGAWTNDRPGVLIDWRRESLVGELCCKPLFPATPFIGITIIAGGVGRGRRATSVSAREVGLWSFVVVVVVALCWVM
jgi:hypothetical protein